MTTDERAAACAEEILRQITRRGNVPFQIIIARHIREAVAELNAEIARLRERVRELESSPTIDELEQYRSPMDEAQARPLRELVREWQARVKRSEDREQEIRDRSGDWPLGRRVESDVDE